MDHYLCARLAIWGFCVWGAWRWTKATVFRGDPAEGVASAMADLQSVISEAMSEANIQEAQQGSMPNDGLPLELTEQKFRDGDEWKPWEELDAEYRGRAALSYLRKQSERASVFRFTRL